jgi:uncharacterized protein (DUF697 family)
MALPVSAGAIRKLLREIESSSRRGHVLAVGGSSELAPVLRQQFFRGGADPAAVRVGGPEGADVYVHVVTGEATEKDEAVLRQARRAHVPVIAVAVATEATLPYVLATDIVPVGAGEGYPLDAIAQAIAARLEEEGAPLAARVPILRDAVCAELVASFARKNGLVGAAVWISRPDLPVLVLNQLRLVLRVAQAYGQDSARDRLPDLAATLGAGLGLRALARRCLAIAPYAGWALKGAVAYGGTRVLGKVVQWRLAAAPRPRPAAGVRA